MKYFPLGLLALCLATPLSALEWGGTVENSTSSTVIPADSTKSSVSDSSVLRIWASQPVLDSLSFLFKGNLSNAFNLSFAPGYPMTDTISGGIDYLVLTGENFSVGRTDFRDFAGAVLNTKLDGASFSLGLGNLDFKVAAGSSALLFKSGSTMIISEDDRKDRLIAENFTKPETLLATPRVVALLESNVRQILPDQTLHLSLVGQYDLRPGQAADNSQANVQSNLRKGAAVSTASFGAGWDGRLWGPLYFDVAGYVSGGTTMTVVGPEKTVTETVAGKKITNKFRTWKPSYLVGGLGTASLLIMVPELSFLIARLGTQVGSWDPDGVTPESNAPTSKDSMDPTLYTAWTGLSQSGAGMIFNPQPANMVTSQLLVSFKVLDTLQAAATSFVFVRPMAQPISESGLRATSSELYLGAEQNVRLAWRPTSDFGASLGLGVFLPNDKALSRTLELKVQASANLSF